MKTSNTTTKSQNTNEMGKQKTIKGLRSSAGFADLSGALTHKALLVLVLPAVTMLPANAGEYTVGLGVIAATSPYVSDKKDKVETGVLPILTYEGERLSVGMGDVSYDVFKQDNINVSAMLSTRSAEFDSTLTNSGSLDSKNKKLEGMKKRKTAIELGAGISYQDLLNFSAMTDVRGAYKGYELDANATLPLPFGKLVVSPSVGVNFQSKGLVNYHYGVSKKESRAGRPEYKPKASVNPYVGVMAMYPVTKKFNVVVGGQYEFFGDAVKDSPIVDKDYTASVFSGLGYTF